MQTKDIKSNRRAKTTPNTLKIEHDVGLLKLIDDLKRRGCLPKDDFLKIVNEAAPLLCKPTLI
jgi:hypothetical protein